MRDGVFDRYVANDGAPFQSILIFLPCVCERDLNKKITSQIEQQAVSTGGRFTHSWRGDHEPQNEKKKKKKSITSHSVPNIKNNGLRSATPGVRRPVGRVQAGAAASAVAVAAGDGAESAVS